jgi:hypothetical protein
MPPRFFAAYFFSNGSTKACLHTRRTHCDQRPIVPIALITPITLIKPITPITPITLIALS